MNENKSERRGHRLGHDALGFILIGIGGFLGASVFMWLFRPQEEPGGTTKLVTDLVGLLGAAPILWLCAGLLFVGARLFLGGIGIGIGRDLLGCAATCLGLIVALGSLSATSAGSFGRATGGAASQLVPYLGLVLGLALFGLSAWYFWVRRPSHPRELEAPFSPSAASTPAPRPEVHVEGAGAEEDAVLLPPEAFPPREALRAVLRDANLNSPSTVSSAPSPYPTDVRRQGGIPDGARPIQPASATRAQPSSSAPSPLVEGLTQASSPHDRKPQQDPSQPVGVHHWTAQRPADAGQPARANLASDPGVERAPGARAPAAGRAPGPDTSSSRASAEGSAVLRPTPGVAGGAAVIAPIAAQGKTPAADVGRGARRDAPGAAPQTSRAPSEPPQPPQSAASAAQVIAAGATPITSPASGGPLPAPSWEQPDLFQPPEEPVDAYGTPISLVEALRADGTTAGGSKADAESAGAVADEDEDSELEETATELDVEEDDESEELDFDEEREVEVILSVDEDEFTEEPLASVEDDLDEDVEAAEVELSEEIVDEPAPLADDDDELEVAAQGAPQTKAPAAKVTEPPSGPIQRSLLDVVEGDAPPTKPRKAPKPRKSSEPRKPSEPVHVLQPLAAPPPSPKSAPARPAAPAKPAPVAESGPAVVDEALIFRAGCMFLERKRVAVSMLQREFGLDFKQATDVLDQLQSSGLIGPYLGGQRRDILLTPEQWRERVGVR